MADPDVLERAILSYTNTVETDEHKAMLKALETIKDILQEYEKDNKSYLNSILMFVCRKGLMEI